MTDPRSNNKLSASRLVQVLGIVGLISLMGAGKAPRKAVSAKPARPQVALASPSATSASNLIASASITTPRTRTVRMEVTAYCPCKKCCGPNARGLTANGSTIAYNGGRFVAADTSVLPFGTKLLIPGYDGSHVEVIDRGGAIKGNRLDVFYPTHRQALEWGRRTLDVTIVE